MPKATLSQMITDLRAETWTSLIVAHGVNEAETLKVILRRVQRTLYQSWDWPEFETDEDVAVPAGTRYIASLSVLDIEGISEVSCASADRWVPVEYGIEHCHYSDRNPDADERDHPIRRYRFEPQENKIEVWPLPSEATTLRFRGQMALPALVNDGDYSLLDGTLIVLFAAAEILAKNKREDASLKLQVAQEYFRTLRAKMDGRKSRITPMTVDRRPRARYGLDYI